MAVYKIFPIQDTTLYSKDQTTNTGLDEILEVGAYNFSNQIPASTTILADLGIDDIRRAIIQFDNTDIKSAIAGVTGSVTSSLRMFLASAENLNQRYTLKGLPVGQSWENGLGKYLDAPTNTLGASWAYRSAANLGIRWTSGSGLITASLYSRGGGAWFGEYTASQEYQFTSNKDVNMDVSDMVNSWTSSIGGAQQNNGILVKLEDSIELNTGSYTGLKFYSRETHTIYPPHLELKWNDFTFVTASTNPYLVNPSSSISQSFINEYSASTLIGVVTNSFTTNYSENVIKDDTFVLVTNNNLGTYKEGSKYQFSFKARDKFPKRVFQTSSVYLDWKYLPTQSYWGIQDYKTKEMVIDFDTVATKLSVTPSGSQFTCYMNGLEPERSYKVLIKSTLESGETILKDQDIIFKVIR